MWYDNEEGITSHLGSLEDFNKLLTERRLAGYDRRERLHEYVVLGQFRLDTCGNCMRMDDTLSFAHSVPKCVTWEAFFQEAKKHLNHGITSRDARVPPPQLFCSYCKNGWDINNCHDVVTESSSELIDLAPYVGKTFEEVADEYNARLDAVYYAKANKAVRNPRHIDLSPKYPHTTKDWEKGVVANQYGWIDVEGAYVIQDGDSTSFQFSKYYHSTCHRSMICKESAEKYRDVFVGAGFKLVSMEEIPNEYCNCHLCTPWYRVKTEFGYINIGWRKKVINIDWGPIRLGDGVMELFEKENVTKGNDSIHAWGWEKAKEYMAKIYRKLAGNYEEQ